MSINYSTEIMHVLYSDDFSLQTVKQQKVLAKFKECRPSEYGWLTYTYKIIIIFLDLEKLIKEAEGTMKDLEAEKVQVTEKPQTNPECLR